MTKISDDKFYELCDFVEESVRNRRSPKKDSKLGILTELIDCWGMYIPYVDKILVSPDGAFEEAAWVYLHEVGHWAIRKHNVSYQDEEQICDDIAFIVKKRLGLTLYKVT